MKKRRFTTKDVTELRELTSLGPLSCISLLDEYGDVQTAYQNRYRHKFENSTKEGKSHEVESLKLENKALKKEVKDLQRALERYMQIANSMATEIDMRDA